MIDVINSIAWVSANILVAYIALGVVVFVVGYYIFFDPNATTAGKMIFRFMLSLVGIILLAFIGTYIDPSHGRAWLEYPDDVDVWRPIVRVIIYAYVAFSITTLAAFLFIRKWRPEKMKKKSDLKLVEPRHPHTGQTTVVTPKERAEDPDLYRE